MKIVSLVPSWTETLFVLGAGEDVVGVTDYCRFPDEAASRTRVGGTKTVNLEEVERLNPDLVLLCREENRLEDARKIMARYETFIVDVRNLDDVGETILRLGKRIGRSGESTELSRKIRSLRTESRGSLEGTHACLVWRNPCMAVGGDRYASSLLAHLGLRNVFANLHGYPEITLEIIADLKPDLLLLPDEPFPWSKEEHLAEFDDLPSRPVFCRGDLLFWHGAWTAEALRRLGSRLSP